MMKKMLAVYTLALLLAFLFFDYLFELPVHLRDLRLSPACTPD